MKNSLKRMFVFFFVAVVVYTGITASGVALDTLATDVAAPTDIATPTDDATPTDSAMPTDPVAPEAVTNPVAPTTKPVMPTEPAAPTEPVSPTDPVAPTEPAIPADSKVVEQLVKDIEDVKADKDSDDIAIIVASGAVSTEKLYASEDVVKIVNKDGEVVDKTANLATGMKVTLSTGETVEIAVLGDVDGTGEIDVTDARGALRAAVKLDELKGVYEVAAKIGNDEVSVSEARLILRVAVKLDEAKSLGK